MAVRLIHFLCTSVSPSINGDQPQAGLAHLTVLLWGSTNATGYGCVWGKLSTFSHLEDMTVPLGSLWHPQRALGMG